jgi:voltage-gated potassium channel
LDFTRDNIYKIFNDFSEHNPVGQILSRITIGMSFFSAISVILETIPKIANMWITLLFACEIMITIFFTLEFFGRMWSCVEDPRYNNAKYGIIRYFFTDRAIIDFLSFLPLIIAAIFSLHWYGLSIVVLFRLCRFLKIGRYSDSFDLIRRVFVSKKEPLVMTMLIGLIMLLFASILLYIAENEAQPEKFPNLFTSMYWAGITLASVGYGDIYPITPLGRLITGGLTFIGIGLFILPTGILASGFIDELQKKQITMKKGANGSPQPSINTNLVDEKGEHSVTNQNNKKIMKNESLGEDLTKNSNFHKPSRIFGTQEKKRSVQRKLFHLLESKEPTDKDARIIALFLFILIILNILAIMLETNEPLYRPHASLFIGFEFFSVVIFTVEYVIRIWICPVHDVQRFREPKYGRISFMLSPMAIIDLLSILPFYLPFLLPIDLRFLRIFRLARIFRVFKMGHYSTALESIVDIFKKKWNELAIASYMVLVVMLFAGTLIYFFESPVQPDKFGSVGDGIWWAIITLSTVGYGDAVPMTTPGRILSVVTAFTGVMLFSLPAGILGAAFVEFTQNQRKKKE